MPPTVDYYQNAYYTSTTSSTTSQYQITWPNWPLQTTAATSSNIIVLPVSHYHPTYQNQPYYSTTANVYQDVIWQQWITGLNNAHTLGTTYTPPTSGQLEAARAERARAQQEWVAACARARTLLEDFLSDEQKTELEHHGRFTVTGSRGRRYCIHASGQSGNVDLLKPDGTLQASLCAHPGGYLPEGDAWLMQMIELRHDEDHFLRTANVHRGSLPAAA